MFVIFVSYIQTTEGQSNMTAPWGSNSEVIQQLTAPWGRPTLKGGVLVSCTFISNFVASVRGAFSSIFDGTLAFRARLAINSIETREKRQSPMESNPPQDAFKFGSHSTIDRTLGKTDAERGSATTTKTDINA